MGKTSQGSFRQPGNLLERLGEDFEKRSLGWCVGFAFVSAMLLMLGALKPFWYDELITYNIATLPSIGSVWPALKAGADLNPPLFHFITWTSAWVFGPSELGLRIPGLVGFLVLCLCLYAFVARRFGPTYGFAAMLLPLISGAYIYATEARAYGLILGFTGLAVVSWQRAFDGTRRNLYLGCMSAALFAALLTHCYALVLLLPFGLAELVRDYGRRRVDWVAWGLIFLPFSAGLTYPPLFATFRPYAGANPAYQPNFHSIFSVYEFLVGPALWPLFFSSCIVAASSAKAKRVDGDEAHQGLALEEIVLACGFLIVPPVVVLLTKAINSSFFPRYGLPAVVGIAILASSGAARLMGRSRAAVSLPVLFLGWAIVSPIEKLATAWKEPSAQAVSLDQHTDLPLVVASGLIYYEMNHYSSLQTASRTWFLTDDRGTLSIQSVDIVDKGLTNLNRLFPLRTKLEDYHRFLKTQRHFLLYEYALYGNNWLRLNLMKDGARLTLLGQGKAGFGPTFLYEVQMPVLTGVLPR